jgi:hypothetical protein
MNYQGQGGGNYGVGPFQGGGGCGWSCGNCGATGNGINPQHICPARFSTLTESDVRRIVREEIEAALRSACNPYQKLG